MTPPPASPGQGPYGASHHAPYGVEGDQPLVRPYAMTGGRTRPRYQLAIEALARFDGPAPAAKPSNIGRKTLVKRDQASRAA